LILVKFNLNHISIIVSEIYKFLRSLYFNILYYWRNSCLFSKHHCTILGYSCWTGGSGLLGCQASSLGELFPTFRWNLPSDSRTQGPSSIWNRNFEEEDTFLRNVDNHLPSDAGSHPRNQES